MKTTISWLLAACMLGASATATAQNDHAKNMVKLNVSAFLFKGIGLQYERQVGTHTTLGMGFSVVPVSTPAFKSLLEKVIDNPRVNVDDFKFGSVIFTPEFRYYFSKKGAFHGFYIAPYVRLGNYHIEGPVTYNSSTQTVRTAIFSGNIKCYSAGLLLGSSFNLSSKIYLDWWILGASIGGSSGSVSAVTDLSDPDERAGLKKELDGTNVPLTSITNEVTPTSATVTSTGTVVGFRGAGICIGIKF